MPMTKGARQRADRFKKWKVAHGLTNDHLAREIPLSFLTIKKYDRGAMPREAIQTLIRAKHPDCPLLPENAQP